jgi:outer membrane receptor protein involved in Fe transport
MEMCLQIIHGAGGPNVLQFTATGEEEILDAEILDNFDAGFKASVLERVFIDAVGFYQKYKNFQSSAWIADRQPESLTTKPSMEEKQLRMAPKQR